jgi:YD repeat-containing protein
MDLSTHYNNAGVTVSLHAHSINAMIYDPWGNVVSSESLTQNAFAYTSTSYSKFLCAGVYKIVFSGSEHYEATNNNLNYTSNDYLWECSDRPSPDYKDLGTASGCSFTKPLAATEAMLNSVFTIPANKKMLLSAWVKEDCGNSATGVPCTATTYTNNQILVQFSDGSPSVTLKPSGSIIDGWQRYEGDFTASANATSINLILQNTSSTSSIYFDDIRIHPYNANMKSYVYDPVNLRLTAELDANNYATFYEYDAEGTLVRTKVETKEGIKTIKETRSSKQTAISAIQ